MKIDPIHRENEAALVLTRWFDYPRHPVVATYLYAHLYKEQTRIFCESFIDLHTAEDRRAFTPDDIFMSRDLTSMWLARRQADELGAPYDFVLAFAMKRAFARTYQHFPRPNQLYGEEFEIDLRVAWDEALATSIRYARSEQYKASNYRGTLLQRGHVNFVLGQIAKRQAPRHNLLGRMFYEDVLSPALVEGKVPEADIHLAKIAAEKLAVSHH